MQKSNATPHERPLGTTDHDRGVLGMTYVYAVVSRRAGGLSIGINLNPNRACNWHCVYCQVPDLVRGSGPRIELERLEEELRTLLGQVVHGDFLERRVPEGMRVLRDVAFSGDGEPTSSPQFVEAIETVGRVLGEFSIDPAPALVLITNGSLVDRPVVQEGLRRLAGLGGEVWFKLDSVTPEGMRRISSTLLDPQRHIERLRRAARLCRTWIQTCMIAQDGVAPSAGEVDAYLRCLEGLVADGTPLEGVLLYTLARPPHAPEGDRVEALSAEWLRSLAERIESLGLCVRLAV